MERYLTEHGIPKEKILKEDRSTSTEENFEFSKEILDSCFEDDYTIAYITNDFHTYRSGCRAKAVGFSSVTHYGAKERMPIEVFRGTVPMSFEGETYPAPIGWETYLRGLYGDYMQLPPEEKRYSDHNLKAFMDPEEDGK